MDTRRWGPGERIIFEPYTKEAYEQAFAWIAQRHIFPEGHQATCNYEGAILTK